MESRIWRAIAFLAAPGRGGLRTNVDFIKLAHMPQDQNPHPTLTERNETRPGGRKWPRAAFGIMVAALGASLALMFAPAPLGAMYWTAFLYAIPNFLHILGEPWQFPAQSALGLAIGGVEIAGLFGVGYGILSLVRPWRRMLPLAAERAALALPVAAVPVSLAVLGPGLAGWVSPGVYGGLLDALLILGLGGWAGFVKDLLKRPQRERRHRHDLGSLAALGKGVLLGSMLALAVAYALAPAAETDELRYHLAAPATWLRDGRIHYIPFQAFSNFPMLGEMLFMPALALGGDGAAKLIHLAFLPVCMMLTSLLARRLGGRRRGGRPFPAGPAFAFIPLVPIIAAWGWIDMFVVAYFLAFVYLGGRALARPRRASGTLLGVVAGGGIGVKYTMLALLGALGAVWCAMLCLTPQGRRRVIRLTAGVVVLTLLGGGAWYAKNHAWTRNPFYPGAYSIFGGGEWSADNAAFFVAKAGSKGMHFRWAAGPASRAVEFLVSPVCATFYPERFEDNPIGPLPLMTLVLCLGWLLARVGRRRIRKIDYEQEQENIPQSAIGATARPATPQFSWVVAATLISWMAWFTTYQSNRFLLPTLALVLALGARAWTCWAEAIPAWARRVLGGLFTLGVIFSFLYYTTQMLAPWSNPGPYANKVDAVAVGLGFEDRDAYLVHKLNYWQAARWLARRARPGEKALLVGEHRTLYFNLPVVASDWFDTPQPIDWMMKTKNNDEMLDLLRKNGVRYIFCNWRELEKIKGPFGQYEMYFKPRFVKAGPGLWERFEALWMNPRLKQIYPRSTQEGVEIFEVE